MSERPKEPDSKSGGGLVLTVGSNPTHSENTGHHWKQWCVVVYWFDVRFEQRNGCRRIAFISKAGAVGRESHSLR